MVAEFFDTFRIENGTVFLPIKIDIRHQEKEKTPQLHFQLLCCILDGILQGLPNSSHHIEEILHIDCNNWGCLSLADIPQHISAFQELQSLDISGASLTYFPSAILTLPKLQKIDLSSNQITEIPKELSSLQELQRLNIFNNQLKNVQVDFSQHPHSIEVVLQKSTPKTRWTVSKYFD